MKKLMILFLLVNVSFATRCVHRAVWPPATISDVPFYHGDLSGLLMDDHPQYLLINGIRPMEGVLLMNYFDVNDVNSVMFVDADVSPSKVGELRYDNTLTGLQDGGFVWYDDDQVRYLVDLAALPSNDDYVVAYDADADNFYMKVDNELTQEEVDDYVDALINDADSVHTRISILYDDTDNAMDFVVDANLSHYDWNDVNNSDANFADVYCDNLILSGDPAFIKCAHEVNIVTNGDLDNYIQFYTTANLPTIGTVDSNLSIVPSDGDLFLQSTTLRPSAIKCFGEYSNIIFYDEGGTAMFYIMNYHASYPTNCLVANCSFLPYTDAAYDLGAVGTTDYRFRHLYLSGDISDETNATSAAEIAASYAHVSSNGTDHSYIDQDVTSGSAPTFTADNFSDGGSNIIPTATQETHWDATATDFDANCADWDAAYGWGDHSGLYMLDAGTPTDNTIPRFDGTDGVTTQTSGVTIDDSNNIETSGTITCGNIYGYGDPDSYLGIGNNQVQYNAGGIQFFLVSKGAKLNSANINPNNENIDFIVNGDDVSAVMTVDASADMTRFKKINYVADTEQITAADDEIEYESSCIFIDPTGDYTLTSTPTIDDGAYPGETITLYCLSSETNTVTLQDEGNLAGSNLMLGGADVVMSANDVLGLFYNGTYWCKMFFTDN